MSMENLAVVAHGRSTVPQVRYTAHHQKCFTSWTQGKSCMNFLPAVFSSSLLGLFGSSIGSTSVVRHPIRSHAQPLYLFRQLCARSHSALLSFSLSLSLHQLISANQPGSSYSPCISTNFPIHVFPRIILPPYNKIISTMLHLQNIRRSTRLHKFHQEELIPEEIDSARFHQTTTFLLTSSSTTVYSNTCLLIPQDRRVIISQNLVNNNGA